MKKFLKLFLVLLIVAGCARTISDLILKVGDGTDADVKIEMELGKGVSNPYLNYDTTNDKFQFCNEGSSCEDMGSGSGGGGVPLLGKGSLLTSDGATNGEFTACANDEIIVYDSAEVNGFKCEAKPSGGGTSAERVTITNGATTGSWTFAATTSSSGVMITLQGISGNDGCDGAVNNVSRWELRRDGVRVASLNFQGSAGEGTFTMADVYSGTATYSAHRTVSGSGMFYCELVLISF